MKPKFENFHLGETLKTIEFLKKCMKMHNKMKVKRKVK
jgi:hypothetical protein